MTAVRIEWNGAKVMRAFLVLVTLGLASMVYFLVQFIRESKRNHQQTDKWSPGKALVR